MDPTGETQKPTGETQKPANETHSKKPYQSPKLTYYGTLVEMTKTKLTMTGNADNLLGVLKTG